MRNCLRKAFFLTAIFLVALPLCANAFDADTLIFEGADLHYRGQVDQAKEKFEAALKLDPDNDYAKNQLALLLIKKDDFDTAFNLFSQVVSANPQNTFAMQWLGILQIRNGELEKARAWFEKIIALDERNATAYYYLGTLHLLQRQPEAAITYLKKARDADADEPETLFRLANAFHDLGMFKNALLQYNRTIEQNPNHTRAFNERGWLYYKQGQVEQALADWQKAISINSRDTEAALNLAKVYNALALEAFDAGNIKKARSLWEKTISYQPADREAKHYLEKTRSR